MPQPNHLEISEDRTDFFGETVILDWIERHLLTLTIRADGKTEIRYTENGEDKTAVGPSLRQVVAGILWEKCQ